MKVLIFTEAGQGIGFGHFTRCLSLYQAFEERGIVPNFLVNSDESIKDIIGDKNFQIFDWVKKEKRSFELLQDTDIAIIDSYLVEVSLYNRISEMTDGRIVMIDDYNRLEYPKGIVVNPSIYGDKLSYRQKAGIVYLLGKDYIILRKEFWNTPEKKVNKEVKNILITFGEMDHSGLIYKIISYLKNKFDFNFYVIEPKKNRVDAKEMLNLMLKADICISGGGQTIYELAKVGVPAIGICFTENQRFNLEGWQEKGFIEYVGRHNGENLLEKIVDTSNKFMSYEERVRRSKIGRNHVDGEGARRIVGALVEKSELGIELKK